jgi:hypothetical protein
MGSSTVQLHIQSTEIWYLLICLHLALHTWHCNSMCCISSCIMWLTFCFGLPLWVDKGWGSLELISKKSWTKPHTKFSATKEWQWFSYSIQLSLWETICRHPCSPTNCIAGSLYYEEVRESNCRRILIHLRHLLNPQSTEISSERMDITRIPSVLWSSANMNQAPTCSSRVFVTSYVGVSVHVHVSINVFVTVRWACFVSRVSLQK